MEEKGRFTVSDVVIEHARARRRAQRWRVSRAARERASALSRTALAPRRRARRRRRDFASDECADDDARPHRCGRG